jgi:hypothetical protein
MILYWKLWAIEFKSGRLVLKIWNEAEHDGILDWDQFWCLLMVFFEVNDKTTPHLCY